MQNFLTSCLALGILCGGFLITGDLGRLAARGLRVIEATDVPDDDAPIPATAETSPVHPDATAPAAPQRHRPNPGGPDRIDLAALRPGQRLFVWLAGTTEPLTVDVVDPASAAVILHRGTPERVAITGGTLVRGQLLRVTPLGLAHAGAAAAPQSIGAVAGLHVDR